MLSPVALALLLAAPQAPGPGTVRGQVRSEQTGGPLPGAVVEVVGAGLFSVADSAGRYVLRAVPAGRRVVRAVHLDHAALEVEVLVPADGELVLDFGLELRPVALPRVTAVAIAGRVGADDTAATPVGELGAAAIRALEATPGVAELGMAEAARAVPGEDPPGPSDVLFVRGASADLKLVLLDGAPVYAPFHLGGLVNTFDPELLRAATLHLGGAPARYDGGISYVLDLETRAPRRSAFHSAGSADLLAGRARVEGPAGDALAYLVAARAVHGFGARTFARAGLPYGYADGLVRLDADVGLAGSVGLTLFVNRESVGLDSASLGGEPARWGNAAGSLRYRGAVGAADAEITAAFGSFEAALPLGGNKPVLAEGASRRARVAADFTLGAGGTALRYGTSFDRVWLRYAARPRAGGPGLAAEAQGDVAGGYLDASWQAAPRLRLRGGLRADVYSLDPALRFAPRLAVTWTVTDRAALTLAAGRYRQYVRLSSPLGAPVQPVSPDDAEPPRSPLAVASATHLAANLDQELGQGVRVAVQGYLKRFEGVPAAGAPAHLPGDLSDPVGQTRASGLDVWLRRNHGRLTGWIGYSLVWIWSRGDAAPAGRAVAGRQLVTAGVAAPLGAAGRFDLRFGYGAGLPYTAVPDVAAAEPPLGGAVTPQLFSSYRRGAPDASPLVPPDAPYLRVDAELSRTWTARVRGARVAITPYLKILNALDRRDALFYQLDGATDELRALAALPLLPVLGVEWRF